VLLPDFGNEIHQLQKVRPFQWNIDRLFEKTVGWILDPVSQVRAGSNPVPHQKVRVSAA
jgi:hypothetical protein